MNHPDAEYYLRRAREEAHRALTSEKPEVAAAHHGLSVRYSARALMARADADRAERDLIRVSARQEA